MTAILAVALAATALIVGSRTAQRLGPDLRLQALAPVTSMDWQPVVNPGDPAATAPEGLPAF